MTINGGRELCPRTCEQTITDMETYLSHFVQNVENSAGIGIPRDSFMIESYFDRGTK